MKLPFNKCTEEHGFTLVELLVSTAIFLVIMMVAAQTFNNIYSLSVKYTKIEESNIEGIVGLELMRHDLEQIGFGLPWGFANSALTYEESELADSSTNDEDKVSTLRAENNENRVPRAFVGLDAFANYSSDFIGVKGSPLGRSKVSQRWTNIPYHNYSGVGVKESRPVVWTSNNLQVNDRVIAVRSNFNDETEDHILIDAAGVFGFQYKTSGIADEYLPQNDQQMNMVYGIDEGVLRMPFNRTDFFIQAPANSPSCAPRTGLLYKAVVNHSDGNYSTIGLLDCVADMQVVMGWDTSEGGIANSVDAYSSLPDKSSGTVTATPASAKSDIEKWLTSPKGIREHLKMVKVYILAQEGRFDRNYQSPASFDVGNVGELSLTRRYNLSAAQQKYHWRVYRIIARPKNLLSNQR